VRDRVGAEIHRRIVSAIGPGADSHTVSALEMTFFGALVNAASGVYTYHQIADRLGYVVGLLLGVPGDNATRGGTTPSRGPARLPPPTDR
jgi:hypothetical protein